VLETPKRGSKGSASRWGLSFRPPTLSPPTFRSWRRYWRNAPVMTAIDRIAAEHGSFSRIPRWRSCASPSLIQCSLDSSESVRISILIVRPFLQGSLMCHVPTHRQRDHATSTHALEYYVASSIACVLAIRANNTGCRGSTRLYMDRNFWPHVQIELRVIRWTLWHTGGTPNVWPKTR